MDQALARATAPSRTRAFLVALLATALASACGANAGASASSSGEPPAVQPEPAPRPSPAVSIRNPLVLQQGMSADIAPATTLTLERIVSDSRCPKDAQCVWAGEVTIALKLSSPAGSHGLELSDRKNSGSAQGFDITLLSYGPCPGSKAVTPLPGECAQLQVIARATR